jgi:hypothetical protein
MPSGWNNSSLLIPHSSLLTLLPSGEVEEMRATGNGKKERVICPSYI